jgi:formyltetrahydrofolate synthetase
MSDEEIKNKVKKALMIPLEETYADDEIVLHIQSCKSTIRSAGVSADVVEADNGLVQALILIYCKTFYGFTNDGSVKELPESYYFLLRQLTLSSSEVSDAS